MTDIFLILVGLGLLFLGGKYLVQGGVELANFFRLPKLLVGLTIVSMGTSAPELIVSIKAALGGHPDISIGNVIGSNISNIALVLGVSALIYPIPVVKKLIKFDWPVMMIATTLLFIFILNGKIQFYEGLLFVIAIIVFNYLSFKRTKNSGEEFEKNKIPWYLSILIIIASSIALIFGADYLVQGASNIARGFKIEERIISVTIIALGTSIPELVTSVIAAFKKETDISIGNIIGSNIFNIFGILGITAMIKEIPVNENTINFDVFWVLGSALLLFIFMLAGNKGKRLSRVEGLLLTAFYISYIVLVLN